MSSLTATFRAKREKLVLTLFVNILLLVLASSAMHYAEHTHQPEEFSSIPATFYWGMVTLTTVGYGDVTPVTPVGQVLTGVIAILGLGLFALPASILADGFRQQAEDKAAAEREARDDYEYCPHCGERLDD